MGVVPAEPWHLTVPGIVKAMTPLAKADQLLSKLITFAGEYVLPASRYAQVGVPVYDCAAVISAVGNVIPHVEYGPIDCNASQLGTFTVAIVRPCSWTSERDGTTNVPALQTTSGVLDLDGDLLWRFAQDYSEFLSKDWTVEYDLTQAGLGAAVLTMTTGID